MNQGVIQIILAAFGSAGFTAVVAGFFARNKTRAESENISAEAAQVIREAAAGMVEDYRKDNAMLRQRLTETDEQYSATRAQLSQTSRQLEDTSRQLRVTTEVLREAIATLRGVGVDVSNLLRQREIEELLRDGREL